MELKWRYHGTVWGNKLLDCVQPSLDGNAFWLEVLLDSKISRKVSDYRVGNSKEARSKSLPKNWTV